MRRGLSGHRSSLGRPPGGQPSRHSSWREGGWYREGYTLSRNHTSTEGDGFGVADGDTDGETVPSDGDGDADADGDAGADGETGALDADPDGDGDADADPDAEGDAGATESTGRDIQLTSTAWSMAPAGSMYTAAVPPAFLTRRTVTTSVLL
jgi:hypothetical protein